MASQITSRPCLSLSPRNSIEHWIAGHRATWNVDSNSWATSEREPGTDLLLDGLEVILANEVAA